MTNEKGSRQFNWGSYIAGMGLYQAAFDEGYVKGYTTSDEYDPESNPYIPGSSEHSAYAAGYEEGWLDT